MRQVLSCGNRNYLQGDRFFKLIFLSLIAIPLFFNSARGEELRPRLWEPYLTTSARPTIHRDPSSSDFTFTAPPPQFTYLLNILPGTAIVTGATTDDARGLAYVASGKTDQPCLHAFYLRNEDGHQAGEVAWTSDGWDNPTRLGTAAVLSAPIIDMNGDVYINDDKFLWAATPDGRLKWKADLPHGEDENAGPFITPIFTASGQVGGITSQGWAGFYDRASGTIKAFHKLPGLAQPIPAPSPSRTNPITACVGLDINDQPMIDPELLKQSFGGIFFGGGAPVANTPAILPDIDDQAGLKSRIYIPATLSTKDRKGNPDVKLFRLDVAYDQAKDALTVSENQGFDVVIKGGKASATSPDVSADGKTVTFGANNGYLYAINADTGAIRWQTEVGPLYGSATITWSDPYAVYIGAGSTIRAINGNNGHLLWSRDYGFLGGRELPEIKGLRRTAIVDGSILGAPATLLVPFLFGYNPVLIPAGRQSPANTVLWPMKAALMVIDRKSGRVEGRLGDLPDSPEGEINIDQAGDAQISFFSSLTSLAHCLWRNHSSALGSLPEPLAPLGGVGLFGDTAP